jgi:hypothetical protein
MKHWRTIFRTVLALGALSSVVAAAPNDQTPAGERGEPQWREIAWPFPRDGWPAGRAFRCAEAACGGDTELYVRPKLGFCNCDTGVADDDEVDRVADIDLISLRFAPREAGSVVRVADMPGRLRSYDLVMGDGARHTAVGIAVSHRCDLLVAVAQGQGGSAEISRAARDFLEIADMRRWMTSALDGR